MSEQQPAVTGEHRRTFSIDVLITTTSKVVFVLCGALITVLIARELGPEGQGAFAVIYSLTLLLVQIGSIGLPVSNPYIAARDRGAHRALVGHSMWLALVVGIALALAVIVIKAVAPDVLRGLSWSTTLITLAALPAALATMYLQGVLIGRLQMAAFSLVEVSQLASSLIALIIIFVTLNPGLNLVVVVYAGGRYVALAVALWSLRHALRAPTTARPGLVRRMLDQAPRVYLVSLVSFALIRLDVLIVNAVLAADDAGQYSIAAFISEGLIVLPAVVAQNLLPRIATTDDSVMTATVFRTVTVVWGAIVLLSLPVAAIGIPLVVGSSYDEAVGLYLWLAPGVFFLGLLNMLTTHYWVRGYPRGLIAAWLGALVLNVVGNLVLLPTAGVVAAPILSTVCYGLVLCAHIAVFGRDHGLAGLRPDPREAVRLIRAGLGRS